MNTRTLYHWLLWLSAACIACLGFLLIRAEQHSQALDAALSYARNRSAMYQSCTPQDAIRKARLIVEAREKGGGKNVAYTAYYIGDKWMVTGFKRDSGKSIQLTFDASGKLANYYVYPD